MLFEKFLKNVITVVLIMSMTGCATMFNGSSQTVTMRSNHDDARFFVNETYIGKGNAVAVFKKKKNYTIKSQKPGCQDTTMVATKSFDPTTLLGILVDYGIISILIVDGAATGAWRKFDQDSYLIDPLCPGDTPNLALEEKSVETKTEPKPAATSSEPQS
jgi:hypothetical protein